MDSNKEEARKAMEIAERKISENDYDGAKEYVTRAETMYPTLDGLKQLSTIIDVNKFASEGGVEPDWYKILGVDKYVDDETVKKQYKKLALLLYPDKNKFYGAEDAFKLVSEALHTLSDEVGRTCYERRRKEKEKKAAQEEKNAKAKAAHDEANAKAKAAQDEKMAEIHKQHSDRMDQRAEFKKYRSVLKKSQNQQRKPSEGDKRAFLYSSRPRKGDYIL